jgi:cytochrome bd-type quinol oxidase subunit 1
MKSAKIAALLALASAFGLMIGCGQKEQTLSEPPAKVEKAAEGVPAEMPKAAEAPAPAVAVTPEVTPAATANIDQAQSQIDKVKSLLADKKYTEALTALKELSAMKLTPDQQTMVDGLKAQVEKAMQADATSDATKSVGGMLGK